MDLCDNDRVALVVIGKPRFDFVRGFWLRFERRYAVFDALIVDLADRIEVAGSRRSCENVG